MADFAKIANETFQILRSYDYTLSMYDEDGGVVGEPEEARRFFAKRQNILVSLVEDDDDSRVSLQYGPTTHANDIMGLDQTLRTMATKYGLLFSARQANKTIEPKDFPSMAAITERHRKMNVSPLTEGMYGTSRSSYLQFENAKMIVRHFEPVNEKLIGARGRCVEAIFIENAAGERLLFPSKRLAPARAMAQHVNHGGRFTDDLGEQIIQMTEDYSHLSQGAHHIANNVGTLAETVLPVREACRNKMRKLRKTFERLSRPSSYTAECKDVVDRSRTLTETTVDETRLTELRRLLNDADLPKQVYESMCKAIDESKPPVEATITEANRKIRPNDPNDEGDPSPDYVAPKTSVRIGDWMVNQEAWDKFKQGKLALRNRPAIKGHPKFNSVYAELCYKLGSIVPVVKDESMQRMLQNVLDDLTEVGEHQTGFSRKVSPLDWKFLVQLGARAIRAAHLPVHENFTRIGAAKQYFDWLDQFDPMVVLAEDYGSNPYSMAANGQDYGDAYDDVLDRVMDDFDAEEFTESPEMLDAIDNRDPHDPEESHLTRDEIMSALREYLYKQAQNHAENLGLNEVNTDTLAKDLYDRACEALQDKGYVVDDQYNDEAAMFEGFEDDGDVLGVEDILLSKPDQGDQLDREVTKPLVTDPDTGKRRPPDANYISRLTTLGNMTRGFDSQAY